MSDSHKDFDPTDAKIADLFAGLEPPADLRRRLMALTPEKRRPIWWGWPLACAAAVLVVTCLLFVPRDASVSAAQTHLSAFLQSDFELTVTGEPLARLRTWLDTQNVPSGADLPAHLVGIQPEGCRVVTWRGRRAALICFPTASGELVHVVMFAKGTFPELPTSPQLSANRAWNMASWSDANADFLVFSKVDIENLRRFLG